MSMKILKGNVKYKDRNDIVCTYGITDNNTAYYFMDSTDTKKFTNGNRIATTLLVEAIDPMVKASNIGVIDPEGNVVIPFENKSIRPVDDNVVIVENSNPVSESVIEAINLRNDPLSATKLVSTPATIKERLNQQMGVEGKYLFNDQFSEATLYDINGNNLINDDRYSFIAQANGKLYMSKNVADSVINEYSLIPSEIQNNNVVSNDGQAIDISASMVDQNVVENAMNDASSSISNEVVDNSIDIPPVVPENDTVNEAAPVEEAPANVETPVDTVASEATPVEETPSDISIPVDAVASKAVPVEEVPADISTPVDAVANEAAPVEEVPANVETPVDAAANEAAPVEEAPANVETPVDAVASEAAPVEEAPADISTPVDAAANEAAPVEKTPVDVSTSIDAVEGSDDVSNVEEADEIVNDSDNVNIDQNSQDNIFESSLNDSNDDVKDESMDYSDITKSADNFDQAETNTDSLERDDSVEDTNDSNLNGLYDDKSINDTNFDDVFSSTNVKTDKIVDFGDYYSDFSSGLDVSLNNYGQADNIMTDVAKSMGELINQNRIQRNVIGQCKGKIENYESQLRIAADRYNEQVKQNETLSNRLREISSSLNRIESKNQLLEQKVHELTRVVNAQEGELKVLRPQVEGKQDLVQLLADARAVLGTNDSYDYSSDSYYRGRAA